MSATQKTIEQLLQDLCDLEDVSIGTSSDDSLFATSYNGKHGPLKTFSMANSVWIKLEGEQWGIYSRLDAIQRVRFYRVPDGQCYLPESEVLPGKESLGVRLYGLSNALAFDFAHLYDEQGHPIATGFARWQELRAKYGGCDELRVENGRLTCLAEGKG